MAFTRVANIVLVAALVAIVLSAAAGCSRPTPTTSPPEGDLVPTSDGMAPSGVDTDVDYPSPVEVEVEVTPTLGPGDEGYPPPPTPTPTLEPGYVPPEDR